MVPSGTHSSGGSIGRTRSIRYHDREDNLIVGPPQSSGGSWSPTGSAAITQRRYPMFVFGLGFLVLFSALSVLLGKEDPRHESDPRDTLALWARNGAR